MLIHDSSFADEMADWAEESKHSTAGEVAALAKEAGVRKLILTHISSRYTDDSEPLLSDSKKVFVNVIKNLMWKGVTVDDKSLYHWEY